MQRHRLRKVPIKVNSTKCELVLSGQTLEVNHPQEAYYAVVPAHLVLDNSECEEMMKAHNPTTIDDMRDKKESRASHYRYSFNQHNSPKKNDLDFNPMFVYSHYTSPREPAGGHNSFSKDLALIKIHQHQLQETPRQQPGVLLQHLKIAMTKKSRPVLLKGTFIEDTVDIDQIFPLQLASTLDKMGQRGVWVMVGGETYTGYMVPTGDPIASHGRMWTCSIQFVSITR